MLGWELSALFELASSLEDLEWKGSSVPLPDKPVARRCPPFAATEASRMRTPSRSDDSIIRLAARENIDFESIGNI
jgi:hypothetical protein